jgi:hypothetical protein
VAGGLASGAGIDPDLFVSSEGPMIRKLAPLVLASLAFTLVGASAAPAGGGPPPLAPGDLLGSTGAVGGSLIDLDESTGAGALRFPLGSLGPVTEIEFRSDGVLFGATGGGTSNILTVDPDTGVETLVGQHAPGAVNGLEFVGDVLYGGFFAPGNSQGGVQGFPLSSLVTVDQTTGALTLVGAITGYSPVRGLAYDETTGTLYGIGSPLAPPGPEGPPADDLFTIDPATAATTPVGSTGRLLGSLEFGPDGNLYAGEVNAGPGEPEGAIANLVLVDPATAATTVVGPTGFSGVSGLGFVPGGQVSPVEIPALSTVGLALLAALLTLAGLAALRRR